MKTPIRKQRRPIFEEKCKIKEQQITNEMIYARLALVVSSIKNIGTNMATLVAAIEDFTAKADSISTKNDQILQKVGAVDLALDAVRSSYADLVTALESAELSAPQQAAVDALGTKLDSIGTAQGAVSDAVDAVASEVDSVTTPPAGPAATAKR
jgi:uncharacterized coiled-coil DUF342 family protein